MHRPTMSCCGWKVPFHPCFQLNRLCTAPAPLGPSGLISGLIPEVFLHCPSPAEVLCFKLSRAAGCARPPASVAHCRCL